MYSRKTRRKKREMMMKGRRRTTSRRMRVTIQKVCGVVQLPRDALHMAAAPWR